MRAPTDLDRLVGLMAEAKTILFETGCLQIDDKAMQRECREVALLVIQTSERVSALKRMLERPSGASV